LRIEASAAISAHMIRPNPVEVLEARIAPAFVLTPVINPDGKSANFVDVDGDVFTVTTTKGTFTQSNFVYVGEAETGPGYLQQIDLGLSTFGKMFQGARITATVDQIVGDGFADVGFINAAGIDLKQVFIDGDLVRIDVGDSNFRTPAIKLFQTAQLGFNTPAESGISDFVSHVSGRINVLEVGDWSDASILVTGGPTTNTERFGSIGRAVIGSITGTGLVDSGTLATSGPIRTLVVQGNIEGGTVNGTGVIFCGQRIGSLSIGGSLIGGDANLTGAVVADEGGSFGSVTVGGSIQGGSGEFSGTILSDGGIRRVTVNGDVTAGSAFASGSIIGTSSKSISIGGSLNGGPAVSGILMETTLSRLTLGGTDGTNGPAYVIGGTAIGKIAVAESMKGARILAGYNPLLELTNPNARIGSIAIGLDLIATDIVAGIDSVNGIFGDSDDRVSPDDLRPGFLSSIGSISVGNIVEGTNGGTDQFGILAERIGSFRIAGVPLQLGIWTIDDLQLGTFGDYRLREVVAVA
jgi:hypothetical protein